MAIGAAFTPISPAINPSIAPRIITATPSPASTFILGGAVCRWQREGRSQKL